MKYDKGQPLKRKIPSPEKMLLGKVRTIILQFCARRDGLESKLLEGPVRDKSKVHWAEE